MDVPHEDNEPLEGCQETPTYYLETGPEGLEALRDQLDISGDNLELVGTPIAILHARGLARELDRMRTGF